MEFKRHNFPKDKMHYIAPSWEELDQLSLDISQQIIAQKKSFDRIVTLAKGGWPMTRSLVDYLEINEVASIGVKFYSGIGQTFDEPQIYQELPISVQGEDILLFDDVADTGSSLLFVKDHLLDGGVGDITTATLFFKPHSKIKPNFFASTTEDWIIFPYDHVEAIKVLGQKWKGQGFDDQEIKSECSLRRCHDSLIIYVLYYLM